MDCGQSWRALAVPQNFSPFSASSMKVSKIGEAQWVSVGQLPHLQWRQARMCAGPNIVLCPLSIMLREAKEDLPDGIYIRFRIDGSLFNLRRLLVRTKTIEELIDDLLFADDCALLAHTEEALQHNVNRFSDAAKNFDLTISLKKTEVLYQPPPREAYSPPHISIDGTDLNAVEHFTYLGSVISNDATVSKDLDNRLSKARVPLEDC